MADEPGLDEREVSYVANIAFEIFRIMTQRADDFGPHPVTDADQLLTFTGVALRLEPETPVMAEITFYSGLIDRQLVIPLSDFVEGAYPAMVADNVCDEVFAHLGSIYGVPLSDLGEGQRIVIDLAGGTTILESRR